MQQISLSLLLAHFLLSKFTNLQLFCSVVCVTCFFFFFRNMFIKYFHNIVLTIFFSVFKKDFPARICYQAAKLPLGANIEIEALALTGNVSTESLAKKLTTQITSKI